MPCLGVGYDTNGRLVGRREFADLLDRSNPFELWLLLYRENENPTEGGERGQTGCTGLTSKSRAWYHFKTFAQAST